MHISKAGFGDTYNERSSRRFFTDLKTSSCITGMNLNLIIKYSIILETISSEYRVNSKTFAKYAEQTSQPYIDLFGRYPMFPTLHKVSRDGATVFDYGILPIGQLSEEAAEIRTKHFCTYRNFSRKFSRATYNKDISSILLLSSDPLLSRTPFSSAAVLKL